MSVQLKPVEPWKGHLDQAIMAHKESAVIKAKAMEKFESPREAHKAAENVVVGAFANFRAALEAEAIYPKSEEWRDTICKWQDPHFTIILQNDICRILLKKRGVTSAPNLSSLVSREPKTALEIDHRKRFEQAKQTHTDSAKLQASKVDPNSFESSASHCKVADEIAKEAFEKYKKQITQECSSSKSATWRKEMDEEYSKYFTFDLSFEIWQILGEKKEIQKEDQSVKARQSQLDKLEKMYS